VESEAVPCEERLTNKSGGPEINGGQYSTDDLKAIAMALTENALLIIHNSKTKSTDDLRAIAMGGR
jgi:hypothetical protein